MSKTTVGADAPEKSNDAEKPSDTKAKALPEVIEEQPVEGGAFVRMPDGSLKREEEA